MVHPDAEILRGGEDVYQWYTAEIKSIPPVTRELFEKYSGVPAGQVISHISEVVRFHQVPSLNLNQTLQLNSLAFTWG